MSKSFLSSSSATEMSCNCLVGGPAANMGWNFHTPLCGVHDTECAPTDAGFGISSWKLNGREVAAPATVASIALEAKNFVASLAQPLPH